MSVCAEIFGNDDYLFCGWELLYGLWKSKLLKHSNGGVIRRVGSNKQLCFVRHECIIFVKRGQIVIISFFVDRRQCKKILSAILCCKIIPRYLLVVCLCSYLFIFFCLTSGATALI